MPVFYNIEYGVDILADNTEIFANSTDFLADGTTAYVNVALSTSTSYLDINPSVSSNFINIEPGE